MSTSRKPNLGVAFVVPNIGASQKTILNMIRFYGI